MNDSPKVSKVTFPTHAYTLNNDLKPSNFINHIMFGIYFILWILLAINPLYRPQWLLENYLVFVLWVGLFISIKKYPLSNLSYFLLILFLILHSFGAHYGYTQVPLGTTLSEFFNSARPNSYDRLVHCSFGLLLTYPLFEFLKRYSSLKNNWVILLPSDFILSMSAIYELIEAVVAWTLPAKEYDPFVGLQGDIWDGFKDMLLAFAGSLFVTLINYSVNKYHLRKLKNNQHREIV